jgi:DNA-binding MarR family transcriptional regulator
MLDNDDPLRRMIEEVEGGGELSQRLLAARLGIALGRANQLLRRLIQQEWVRGIRLDGHRMRYVVTPAGAAARARMARERLRRGLASYRIVREHVRQRLLLCASECAGSASDRPAVVVYGTGEAAQIAVTCMADLRVQLVGFVDDIAQDSFHGLPVRAPNEIASMAFNGRPFDRLIVATLDDYEGVRGRLQALGVPLERVSWL